MPSSRPEICDVCWAAFDFDDSKNGGLSANTDEGTLTLEIPGQSHSTWEAVWPQRDQPSGLGDDYPSLPRLTRSAAQGCRVCGMLKNLVLSPGIGDTVGKNAPDTENFELEVYPNYDWQSPARSHSRRGLIMLDLLVRITAVDGFMQTKTAPWTSRWASFTIEGAAGPCRDWLGLSLSQAGPVLTPEAIAWTREKILECERGLTCFHGPQIMSRRHLPSRLLKVDCDPPRLVITRSWDTISEPTKYVALSYCWGDGSAAKSQLKTTRTTLEENMAGVSAASMTDVVRDAVQVARAMDVPYLWIDALCILQDDHEDWERESAAMGDIFSGAYFTILALKSTSCLEGFLNRGLAPAHIPFRSRVRPEIKGSFGIRPISADQPYSQSIFRHWIADFTSSVWVSRGWTFQEMAMSTRFVAFGNTKLHFVCPGSRCTFGEIPDYADDPERDKQLWSARNWPPGFFQTGWIKGGEDDADADSGFKRWFGVIEPYSSRRLTRPTDRFPALSGVAHHFRRLLNDEYVAGHWRGRLHDDLWFACFRWLRRRRTLHPDEPQPPTSLAELLANLGDQRKRYVAPSWSWASRWDVAGLTNSRHLTLANIEPEHSGIEPRVHLAGLDECGEILSAELIVRTRVVPMSSDIVSPPAAGFWVGQMPSQACADPNNPFARCWLDWAMPQPDTAVSREGLSLLLLGSADDCTPSGEGSDAPDSEESEPEEDHAQSGCRVVYGLVIHPVPLCPSKYFRVGAFLSSSRDGYGMPLFEGREETVVTLI